MSPTAFPPGCPGSVKLMLQKRKLTTEDVQRLRRNVFGDGVVGPDEAELLFTIHHRIDEAVPEWRQFFIEALTDYLVQQAEPRGFVSPENAVWLIEKIMADGHVETATELEAVIKVLETARSAPPQLAAFTLMHVRHAILHGHGAARQLAGTQGEGSAGRVTRDDVALLRRVLYAAQSEGGIGVSRDEAAVLFDINDDTEGSDNAPEWAELFAKAIGNAMLFACGYEAPTREQALRQEAFLESREGVGGFLSRMVGAIGQGKIGVKDEKCVWEQRLRAHQDADRSARSVTSDEAQWLIDRIGHDGRFSPNERAAIQFIASETKEIDPALHPLIEKLQGEAA